MNQANTKALSCTPEDMNSILSAIDEVAIDLATQVEDKDKGNYFGIQKYNQDSRKADDVGNNIDLPEYEKQLFKIILKGHDIGRHQEALDRLDTLRNGPRHGKISAKILEENSCLELLDEEERNIILSAISFHSEKDVNLDKDSVEYELCYILRDLDKKEIIDDEKLYGTNEGIFQELNVHYFGNNLDGSYKETITQLIESPEYEIDPSDQIQEELKGYLGLGIHENAFNSFKEGKLISIPDIKYSYATYMLMHIAMVFDVSNNDVLLEIINVPMFKKRLDFIKKRISNEEYQTIITTLRDFIEQKVNNSGDFNQRLIEILS